jgi:phosphoglycerol transferase MdoB-like AlkP superfamily enzyme
MLLAGLTLLSLFFYTGLRALYLIWNHALYGNFSASDLALAFLHGLRFDLSAVAILTAPALLLQIGAVIFRRDWKRIVVTVFLLFQVPFLLLNLFDTEYVQFTGRRFTISLIKIVMGAQGQIWTTISAYGGLLAIAVLISASFCFLSWRWMKSARPLTGERKLHFAGAFLGLVLAVVAARGGLQSKPLGFAHAQVFANPVMNHLTMNSTFSFVQSLRRAPLPREHHMSSEEMRAKMNGSAPGETVWIRPLLSGGPQNIVIVILESFSLEHMGKIHGDRGYTPFLDDLAERSLFFPNAFANARRSIEGIGAILGGIPALMSEPFISSTYATNTFFGLGTLLGQYGYSSAFFHGGNNGTMYFDQFIRSAGITRYYGANEYPNPADHDGTWGIWDKPFLLNMVKELKNQPEPFAVGVFTLSSHNPFVVPKEEQGKFPKGTSEIHEVVGYTDDALREFFAAASKEPWYDRTLFIVTADHTYKPVRPQYQNDLGNYRIPLLFFHPKISKWPEVDVKEPVQQIDILPSILDFLGKTPKQQNLLGRSVFRKGPRSVVLSSDGYYWLITKDHVLTMDTRGDMAVAPAADESVRKELLERLLATRQYFSEGLWDNKLYFPSGR